VKHAGLSPDLPCLPYHFCTHPLFPSSHDLQDGAYVVANAVAVRACPKVGLAVKRRYRRCAPRAKRATGRTERIRKPDLRPVGSPWVAVQSMLPIRFARYWRSIGTCHRGFAYLENAGHQGWFRDAVVRSRSCAEGASSGLFVYF